MIESGRQAAYGAVNAAMIQTYWKIGQRIVEEEQKGADRAEYGTHVLQILAADLTREYGKGFDERRLRDYRQFYLYFNDLEIRHSRVPNLTWTHYRTLLRVTDESPKCQNGPLDVTLEEKALLEFVKVNPKADADAIYLTREEVQKITDIDLSDKCQGIQDARDIFLIGVWTAQRVSDYNNIQPEDIRRETIRSWDEDGDLSEKTVRTIHIVQQKTGKKVVITCNKALRTILDKYPDGLPHLSEQKINKYLKEIGELCEFNDIVEVRNTKGGTLQTETFKKYELIHTHTARRTGATLMFLSGMNVYDICKITGHSNIKTLERYIKANELETMKKITDTYDYFK